MSANGPLSQPVGPVMVPPAPPPDPLAAADRYKRAAEMADEARRQLVSSIIVNRSQINLRGLAVRVGVDESTLRKWVRNGDTDGG